MNKLNHAHGLSIHISNHPEYRSSLGKYNLYLKSNYEAISNAVASNSSFMELDIEDLSGKYLDKDRTTLLSKIMLLGKIDGDAPALKYYNEKISKPTQKISEYDIMLSRLNKIIPLNNEVFSEEFQSECRSLYESNGITPESQIVQINYILEILKQYLISSQRDPNQSIKYIQTERKRIVDEYCKNNTLELREDLRKIVDALNSSTDTLTPEHKAIIDELIENIEKNDLDKEDIIKALSNLSLFSRNKVRD